MGHGRILLARGLQLRVLAGQRRLRPGGVQRLCLPRACRLWRHALRTPEALYDKGLGQFILPYDAVRQSPNPDELLLGFLQETYEAAAKFGKWDRQALERQ